MDLFAPVKSKKGGGLPNLAEVKHRLKIYGSGVTGVVWGTSPCLEILGEKLDVVWLVRADASVEGNFNYFCLKKKVAPTAETRYAMLSISGDHYEPIMYTAENCVKSGFFESSKMPPVVKKLWKLQ